MLIVLDPGHGGEDPGACGPGRTRESDINLAVAVKAKDRLDSIPGLKCELTRTGDFTVELAPRAQIANDLGADCFISIHCNGSTNSAAHGTESYNYPGSVKGALLAAILQDGLVGSLGLTDRMVKEADLAVLRMTHCPAALVEIAFITNPAEEKMLQEEGFQDLAAEAIAQAAAKFLNLKLPAIEPVEKPLRVNAGGKVIPCQMLGDKVWVPVRDLAESLGHKVDWYEEDQTVKVS